jgi:hypothetical protein
MSKINGFSSGKKWYFKCINALLWIIVAFSTGFLTCYPQN